MSTDLLRRILARPRPGPFALLHRPRTAGRNVLEVLLGEVSTPATLAGIPLPDPAQAGGGARHDVLALVPYRQITERGFEAVDDGSPLIALTVTEQAAPDLDAALELIPDTPIEISGGHFDIPDQEYAEIVRRVISDEIGRGEGANFVIKRSFVADITHYTPMAALTLFRRLVLSESGTYWTFVVHTGERTLVGASPERHISLHDGVAVMNPISGTYRYPPCGPTLPGVLAFLADRKEADELYMVVDEELKMMARICDGGGRVVGPYLKEMARLAHTEYLIEGHSSRDPREILHETMFAPTVTGSPLENASRVIGRHEPNGRGYYSGMLALIGRDETGARTLDSSILIRTADIDPAGRLTIGVGATLVRHSDPASEVAETRAKAAGLLAALETDGPHRLTGHPGARTAPQTNGPHRLTGHPGARTAPETDGPHRFAGHPGVRAALEQRNRTIAAFWREGDEERRRRPARHAGRRVLVVDAEDTFTAMIHHQLRALGLTTTVRRYDEPYDTDGHDLVVMGPGPGDPRRSGHPKVAHLRSTLRQLLTQRQPFLAVCLSHQVLCGLLGLELRRRDVPNQGVQKEIELFGSRERVGFYNTFAAVAEDDKADIEVVGVVEVSRDARSGEVHALRGPFFASMQFHAESLLTQDGPRIVAGLIDAVLHTPTTPTA